MPLLIDVGMNERLVVGDAIITPKYKSGGKVRLQIDAPQEVDIKLDRLPSRDPLKR